MSEFQRDYPSEAADLERWLEAHLEDMKDEPGRLRDE